MVSPHLPDPESALPLKSTVTWVKRLVLKFGLKSSHCLKTLIRQHTATLVIWDVIFYPTTTDSQDLRVHKVQVIIAEVSRDQAGDV